MGFAFETTDESVQAGVRRIAREQVDTALDALRSQGGDAGSGVHDARKACKKLRGLLRLLRPSMPGARAKSPEIRDAARLISGLRDREAMIEVLDRLVAAGGAALDTGAAARLRAAFEERRAATEIDPHLSERRTKALARLGQVRRRAKGWHLRHRGFKALRSGIVATWARAGADLDTLRETAATPERLHDWRKRVKDNWYQMRLFEATAPDLLGAQIAAAGRLGDLLGEHQDLYLFRAHLADGSLPRDACAAMDGPAVAEMDRLEGEALALGARLLVERPEALADRIEGYWRLWGGPSH